MKHYAADECRDNLQSFGETLPYEFYIQESCYFESDYGQIWVRSFSLFTIIFRRIHSHFISGIAQLCCKLYSTAVKHHPFINHKLMIT